MNNFVFVTCADNNRYQLEPNIFYTFRTTKDFLDIPKGSKLSGKYYFNWYGEWFEFEHNGEFEYIRFNELEYLGKTSDLTRD